jgi:hypothetical protein
MSGNLSRPLMIGIEKSIVVSGSLVAIVEEQVIKLFYWNLQSKIIESC